MDSYLMDVALMISWSSDWEASEIFDRISNCSSRYSKSSITLLSDSNPCNDSYFNFTMYSALERSSIKTL